MGEIKFRFIKGIVRKEVIKMTEKNGNCGCGCIAQPKGNSAKTVKAEKKTVRKPAKSK